jgi:hypothetical protein
MNREELVKIHDELSDQLMATDDEQQALVIMSELALVEILLISTTPCMNEPSELELA